MAVSGIKYRRISIGGGFTQLVPVLSQAKLRKHKALDDLQNKVVNAVGGLGYYLVKAMERAEPELVRAVANKQMYNRGVDGNLKRIQPPYAKSTIRKKKKKGQPYTRVTLRDRGRFHESLHLEIYPDNSFAIVPDYDLKAIVVVDGVEQEGDFEYVRHLIGEYGKKVLRISPEYYKSVYKRIILPYLMKNFKGSIVQR